MIIKPIIAAKSQKWGKIKHSLKKLTMFPLRDMASRIYQQINNRPIDDASMLIKRKHYN